jgi:hypothetical protein
MNRRTLGRGLALSAFGLLGDRSDHVTLTAVPPQDPRQGGDLGSISVKAYGAVGDGVTDDIAAFEAAIAAVKAQDGRPARGWRGNTIDVPFGIYRLSRTLVIPYSIVLRGAGGAGWFPATKLVVDPGHTGISIRRDLTANPIVRADWTTIEHLAVGAAGKTTTAHGIQANAIFNLSHVSVHGFKGDGLHIEAAAPTDASNSLVEWSRFEENDGNGVFVRGQDANNICFFGVVSDGNGGWGFYENGFLGNRYIATHSHTNALGPFFVPDLGVNATDIIGAYTEGGQPPSKLGHYVTVYGGTHGAGFTDDTTATIFGAQGPWRGVIRPSLTVYNKKGAKWIRTRVGMDNSSQIALGWATVDPSTQLDDSTWDLQYVSNGWWYLMAQGDGTKRGLAFSTPFAAEGAGAVKFPRGFYMMEGPYARLWTAKPAPPTTGAHLLGEIVWNVIPVAGGPMGWVCTARGDPGMWRPFGTVEGRLESAVAWDPPTVGSLGFSSTTITVAGASVGNPVSVGFSPAVPAGVILTAQVTAANTVTVTLFNAGGEAVDLASGTLRVEVRQ